MTAAGQAATSAISMATKIVSADTVIVADPATPIAPNLALVPVTLARLCSVLQAAASWAISMAVALSEPWEGLSPGLLQPILREKSGRSIKSGSIGGNRLGRRREEESWIICCIRSKRLGGRRAR